jgi:exonuclease SbcC
MILKKVKLFPFAGVANKEVVFDKGLNIISGPNEAGKSTIVRAILSAFFGSTKLTPAQEKSFLALILPIGGGDTVRVNLEFESDGIDYTLEKSWGGTKSSTLYIGGGKSISDPEAVQKKLLELLKLNEATWKNMLFTRQTVLDKTIDDIQKQSEISTYFSDLLRGAVMVQGGISPEKLNSNLAAIEKEYYNNWDSINDSPPSGKGINNKAINNVGKILRAYYSLEESKRDLNLCIAYEQEIDQIAKNIDTVNSELSIISDFVKKNEEVAKDTRVRQKLEGDLVMLKSKLDIMKKDQVAWPQVKARFDGNASLLIALDKNILELKNELAIAVKKENAASNIKKYNSVIELQGNVKKAEEELEKCKKVETSDLSSAKSLSKIIDEALITLNAQQLKIQLLVKKDFKGTVIKGVSAPEDQTFKSGEQINLDAPGIFGFETVDFSLNVVSGKEDIQMLSEHIVNSKTSLNLIFEKYNSKDLLELNTLAETEKGKKDTVEEIKKSLKAVLGTDDIDALKKEMEELKNLPSVRETAVLRAEDEKKKEEKAKLSVTHENDEDAIDKFIQQYETIDKLNDVLLDKNTDLRAFEKQVKELKPLPDGMDSAEDFVKDFDLQKTNFQLLKEKLSNLIIEKTSKEKEEPNKTSDELKQDILLFQKELDRAKLEGAAYKKIRNNLSKILENEAENVFSPYYEKTKMYFSELTGGKYKNLTMQNIIPSEVNDGTKNLRSDMLSQGTKDSLALALRLSMADYYLEGSDGFIVMDDPLTDMDPGRQIHAADCIRNFSQHKQVIIFTCHDSHNKILNGHCILMDENSITNN